MNTFLVRYSYLDLEGRARHRAEHISRLESLHEQGHVVIAGPFADLSGAVLVIRARNQAAAKALIADDIYSRSGVIGETQIQPFTVVVGN